MKKISSASYAILLFFLSTQAQALDTAENNKRTIDMVKNITSITSVCGAVNFALMQEEEKKNGQNAAYTTHKEKATLAIKAAKAFGSKIGLSDKQVTQQTVEAISHFQKKLAVNDGRNETLDLEKKCAIIFGNFPKFIDQEYKKYGVQKTQ